MSTLMRKLVGRASITSEAESDTKSDNTLGLMHLRKLFADFRHPSARVTQKEQEDKLYNMLPLFCKVFGNSPANDMTEKFGDILQFCSHVSKLMVTEIRRLASNQSTEAASTAIVEFLQIESTEETSNGWMLLSTLNLLSLGNPALIDCMTAASLPSTFVKCLYLFFDLPELQNVDVLEKGCQFTPRERRILLQKVFVQVLVRLVNNLSPAEELARKDDLSLLFSAITSWCPQHNVAWRKSAGDVLVTLSRHGLSNNVVKYIHEKGCVRHCVENMQRVQSLSPLELVDMFVTVFCFLKDSSEVSQILIDDFKSCQGYVYLSDFVLRLESDSAEESVQALRNLVLLVGSLTTCGFSEIKPNTVAAVGSLFHMPGFTMPQPTGKGVSVRNLQAFQVLQNVFLKAHTSHLCGTILDVISSIYHQDNANYFILEPQHTLSQFAEKIYLKPVDIQEKFFDLLEFIVFELNFVPCKELISLSILIKSQQSIECSILCIKALLKILQSYSVYKDVYREVGLLEVLVTCLHRYAAILKEEPDGNNIPELQRDLGFLVMDGLSLLLNGNSSNANVFRECGGARCVHNMVPYSQCRSHALNIIQQLILAPGGDDDMGTLLGLMYTVPMTALQIKAQVLKSLLHVLRESHRSRTVFRKVGGFVYIMSVLVSMEGCLADPPKSPWDTVCRKEVLTMLRTLFSTITIAMRYEPASAKFFSTEVRYDSLTEAVRLLGCFSSTVDVQKSEMKQEGMDNSHDLFQDFFHHADRHPEKLPLTLQSCIVMIRNLHEMALDVFDRQPFHHHRKDSPNPKRHSKEDGHKSLNLTPHPELHIVHPGAVISIFHLLPSIDFPDSLQLTVSLQLWMLELLKDYLHAERNQQVLCDAGFTRQVINHSSIALADESHPLHPSLRNIFERLASQSLTPSDLRDFLRLGSPLNCLCIDDIYTHDYNSSSFLLNTYKPSCSQIITGGPVPLTRVKCLVSMTTPRDTRLHGSSVTPAFVEFDMSSEGFGCLYLPSIAPQGPPTPSVVGGVVGTTDSVVIGGIGTGERVYPPQSGLTYSSWFCVEKFSQPAKDSHPARLLTIVRNIQGRDENLICLNVFISSKDRALIVSTQENVMPTSVTGTEQETEPGLNENTVRFWCPELTQEGQWHHLVLIFHRAGIMKNSSVSLYLNGDHLETLKLHYISPNLGGGGTASPTAVTSVFCYIGTPPQLRRQSQLTWRQGPSHLFEDIISSATVKAIYNLDPNYTGSFQAPLSDSNSTENSGALFSEEKLIFGVHPHAMSQMTVAKIRKVYNKVDSKSIAKQLAMSAHDNITPIRIIHNSAGHLSGSARSLGAILMGYLGVRTFCPRPVARVLENIGGASILLGLIAMAKDVEELYAAVKALVCVVRSNTSALLDMDRIRGYQTLATLYKKKQHLLNSHILHLTFSLVGTVDSGRETSVIPNKISFEDLLCELEIWHDAPSDLQRSLYEHFYELLTDSSDQRSNLIIMREVNLASRLLHILMDSKLSVATIHIISKVLVELLHGTSDPDVLRSFGQFVVSTLSTSSVYEKDINLSTDAESVVDPEIQLQLSQIKLRNTCLDVIMRLIKQDSNIINNVMCEEVQRVLGYDWLLLFLQGNLHPSTVVLALKIIINILRNSSVNQKFRDGVNGGGWLANVESVSKTQMEVMLGFNVGTNNKDMKREVNKDICNVPGFTVLQWMLPKHTDIPDVYFLLMALLLGQHHKELPSNVQLNLDAVWSIIFGVPASKSMSVLEKENKNGMCHDAALVILAMVRDMLNQHWEEEELKAWLQDYPVTLMQFFLFLYHNQAEFTALASSNEFINGLAASLFPYRVPDADSDVTTPIEEFKPFPESDSIVYVRTPDKMFAGLLSGHPARKFVIDFLRTIIIDNLSQSSSNKMVVDIVMEASPDHATRQQQHEFQTEIMKTLMEHLLAADVLLGDQAALPIGNTSSYSLMANNVFYFAGRVVDKLWQGVYTRDSKEVFEFICKLISQAKKKASGLSLDPVYKCLNRTILFQLSRPIDSVSDQTNVLECLHKLTSNRNLVFGPGNFDNEFVACLAFCLMQLVEDPSKSGMNLSEMNPRRTTWHVETGTEKIESNIPTSKSTIGYEGLQLIANAAKRVWEELYTNKKSAMEDVFKTQLTATQGELKSGDLKNVRPLILEMASRMWVTYAESERKQPFTMTEKFPNQLQTKLQRVGSGVLRFASRKTKKEMPLKLSPVTNVHQSDYRMWTCSHMCLVNDLVVYQHKQHVQTDAHFHKFLLDEWTQAEKELLRERGLWGPYTGSKFDKWMLDMTEGPFRMRKKMMRNDMFYIHYPYRPDMENSPLKYKVALSTDSKDYYMHFRSQSLINDESLPIKLDGNLENTAALTNGDMNSGDQIDTGTADVSTSEVTALLEMPTLLKPKKANRIDAGDNEDDIEEVTGLDGEDNVDRGDASLTTDRQMSTDSNVNNEDTLGVTSDHGTSDNQTLLRLLEKGEKISHMFRCARISGLDTSEGLLLFGKEHFYVIDGFTLLKTREIKDIDTLPPDLHDPIIPKASKSSGSSQKRICSKFAYDEIREVHKRRYLLQPIAVEVFSADGRNYLLAFPRKTRNKVYAKCLSVGTGITDNAQQSVSGQKQNARVEPGTSGLISSLIGEKTVTQRWEKGEINNFQYLMHLNTLAGRSYNDLMQYPVFPWILSDYESEEVDLSNPLSFRDLSKPMGAQTPDRLKQFKKRYQDWDDPQGETPPYHYGTHYSSAMIVASFLVRMEPFTQHFLKLQGGHFDLADRMFHSIRDTWLSAAKHNMADVKELIPEFFYLPEFLNNSNSFDLGCKQSGIQLGDVVLPTWAKNDPREFIRAHREALESDYVSAHLHEWIDLIFGYKQRGPPSVDAVNVFHHLFYEGNVDIYGIDDPLKKNAIIGFINNFGQIPKQLFKRPHIQKRLNIRALDPISMGSFGSSTEKLFFYNVDNLRPTMQPIKELKGHVGQIIQNEKYVLAVEQNKVLIPPTYNKYLAWGFADLSLRIGLYESDKALCILEEVDEAEILTSVCPNSKIFITGGISCVVNVWEYVQKEKRIILKQPLYGHTEPVTSLAATTAYNLIVSGSRDRTCILWDLSRLVFVRQLGRHVAPVAAVCINELTGDIATCAGTCLHVWTINGDEIACVNTATARNHQILCLSMSQMMEWGNRNVILTGSSDGVVRMWSVEYVQVPDDTKNKQINYEKKNLNTDLLKIENQDKTAKERLQDFKNPDYLTAQEIELGSSAESESHLLSHYQLKLKRKDDIVNDTQQESNLSRTSSVSDLKDETDEHVSEKVSELSTDVSSNVKDTSCKDDVSASVSHEFVVITDHDIQESNKTLDDVRKSKPKTKHHLREGFKWQRQLVFRSKLTMHTAFERKDNKDPAAITSIAISKDHKTVYVGDSKGRIYSWSVTDQPGRVIADHWMKDEGVENCLSCGVKFSFSERRHHCRNCGQVFCSKCSRFETDIRRLKILRPVRVCQSCYNSVKSEQLPELGSSRS